MLYCVANWYHTIHVIIASGGQPTEQSQLLPNQPMHIVSLRPLDLNTWPLASWGLTLLMCRLNLFGTFLFLFVFCLRLPTLHYLLFTSIGFALLSSIAFSPSNVKHCCPTQMSNVVTPANVKCCHPTLSKCCYPLKLCCCPSLGIAATEILPPPSNFTPSIITVTQISFFFFFFF